MARLDRVKSWMGFFGWTNGGGPGSVLRDAAGTFVADYGSQRWKRDVISACIRDERDQENERLIEEISLGLREPANR